MSDFKRVVLVAAIASALVLHGRVVAQATDDPETPSITDQQKPEDVAAFDSAVGQTDTNPQALSEYPVSARLIPPPPPPPNQFYTYAPRYPTGQPARFVHSASDVFNTIPSPVGTPIFLTVGEVGRHLLPNLQSSTSAIVPLYHFAYNCGSEQCEGTASDVWLAMPSWQKEVYLTTATDAIDAAFVVPRVPIEIDVEIEGTSVNIASAIRLVGGVHSFAEPEVGAKSNEWVWQSHLSH